MHAKSLQMCLTVCDPKDCSLPGSSVHGILQPGILEWVVCPPPKDLPDPGIETASLMSPALAGGFFTTSATWASYYMDTRQTGLRPTCMTLFNFNYLFEGTLLRQSHSEVLGVRTTT